ncbi:MAG: hypothetical protein HZB15_17200 [Actinobacteria bacterium]|nr:hypothetical protein [Actinomycetota bacterium]
MAWATTQGATRQGLVVDGLARRLSLLLPETSLRARGWLERGAAIVPAFEGRMQPIVSYTRAVAARGDDLELSIYAGFAAYMLALVGRLDEADHWLGELRRLTRRHQTTFAVETIGNGYAAAIVSEALRGDLRVATRRRECAAPTGSVFALTAAAALGQVALWTRDPDTMQCAVEWSRRPTVPMLACSAPLVSCAAATLDDEVESAADHAEDFAELAPRVPVYFVQGWPTCNAALLAGGRLDVAHATTERAASLVDGMESAPFSIAAVHLCRAQIAAHRADIGAADRFARDALRIAAACRFELLVVDSLELIAAAAACRGETAVAGALAGATEARRRELGYRFRASGAARARAPIGAAGLTISGAIDLVRTTGQ